MEQVIEFLSHLHLLIAVAPLAGMGFLALAVGFIYEWLAHRAAASARLKVGGAKSENIPADDPKTAHA